MTPSRSRMTSFIGLFFEFRHADAAIHQPALARFEFLHLVPERLLEVEVLCNRGTQYQDEQIGDFFGQLVLVLTFGHALGDLAQLLGHQRHTVGHVLAALLLETMLGVKRLHRREHGLIGIGIHCSREMSATPGNNSLKLLSSASRLARTAVSSTITMTLSKNPSTAGRSDARRLSPPA